MVQASQPIKKDTAPPEIMELADRRLLGDTNLNTFLDSHADVGPDNLVPTEWLEAAAQEAYVAATEALDEWMRTLIAGRPYDTPLVEWEHRELNPVAEMLAEHGRARRELGESLMHDCIPWDDAKEVAQQ